MFEALGARIIEWERVGSFSVSGMLIWENGTGTEDSFVWNSVYVYNWVLGFTHFSFPVLSIPSSYLSRVFIISSLPSVSLLFLWRGHGNLLNVSYTTVKKKVKSFFCDSSTLLTFSSLSRVCVIQHTLSFVFSQSWPWLTVVFAFATGTDRSQGDVCRLLSFFTWILQ